MEPGPATHAGIGAECRRLPSLPLRAGVARLSGGCGVAGGFGLGLRGFHLDLAASHRKSDPGRDATVMLPPSFVGN